MIAAPLPKRWDHETDVIIAGGGTAGLPVAIKVREAGQKAAGIEDSPDMFYDDLVNVGAVPAIAWKLADTQLEAYRIFK